MKKFSVRCIGEMISVFLREVVKIWILSKSVLAKKLVITSMLDKIYIPRPAALSKGR